MKDDDKSFVEIVVDVVKGTISQIRGDEEAAVPDILIGDREVDFTGVEDLKIKIVP